MKKIIYLVIGSLISTSVLAQPFVYCPDSIQCTEAGKISSCRINGGTQEYWDIYSLRETGSIETGTYTPVSVSSYYQYPQSTITSCSYHYTSSDGKISKSIGIYSKSTYNLQANIDGKTAWYIYGYNASCSSADFSLCPMTFTANFGR